MPRTPRLFASLALAAFALPASADAAPRAAASQDVAPPARDFVAYCTQPANESERLTVGVMMNQVGELAQTDRATCTTAAGELEAKTFLNLWPNPFEDPHPPIVDLGPVGTLTHLDTLSLSKNAIVDVTPLAALTGLTSLELWVNQVKDLTPLAGLTALTDLGVGENQVTSLAPLAGLTQLSSLDAHGNAIDDVTPLAGLAKLTWIDLENTNVADLAPLAGLADLTDLLVAGSLVCTLPPAIQKMTQPHASSTGETIKLTLDGFPSTRCAAP
jgi:internalin A